MTSEQTKTRITKLLALASNNPNRAEAEAALLKAQELMAEDQPEINEPEPEVVEVLLAKGLDTWFLRLALVLAPNFRTVALMRDKTGISCLLGTRDDVGIAKAVILAAKRKAQTLAAQWWIEHPDEPLAAQAEFLMAYVDGLEAKFAEQVMTHSYTPALTLHPEILRRIADWGESELPPATNLSDQARQDGLVAGREHR